MRRPASISPTSASAAGCSARPRSSPPVDLCEISVEVQIAATSDQARSGATVFLLGVVSSVTNRRSRRPAQSCSSSPRVPGDPPATRSLVQPARSIAPSIRSTARRLSLPPQVSQCGDETGIGSRVSPGDGRRAGFRQCRTKAALSVRSTASILDIAIRVLPGRVRPSR